MSELHESIIRGLQDGLDYVRGDETKGRSTIVYLPDDEISVMYNKLDEKDKYIVRGMLERLSALSSR